MSKRDFYEVLGVAKGTDKKEIKKAFRRMAMKYHPDRNPGDKAAEESFKEVNEAYEILSDDQKKAAYDRHGHAGVDPNAAVAVLAVLVLVMCLATCLATFLVELVAVVASSVQRGSDLRYTMD